MQEYRELIEQELNDLDIGIVCLNAGCWVEGPTDLVSDADFERTFGLNGLHVMYFTKALMPKLVGRGQKSAILATSSVLAHGKMPGIAAYTATKALVSNFMESLHFEIAHFCDVTCWEPGPCQTNLFENGTQPPKGVTITAQKAVAAVLAQLGRARVTNGNYWFYFMSATLPPLWMIGTKTAKQSREEFARRA